MARRFGNFFTSQFDHLKNLFATDSVLPEMSDHNVFIFNNIQNNAKDVQRLCETFSALSCKVRVVENTLQKELVNISNAIMKADFSKFNYIVIIILDNTNENENMWTTTDGEQFRLNADLITQISRNESLKGKLRFSILQTNRHFNNDDIPDVLPKELDRKHYTGKDVKYYATSIGCSLKSKWGSSIQASPFITILCDAIEENIDNNYPIKDLLNRISDRVADETNEFPSKEMNFDEPYILGKATI